MPAGSAAWCWAVLIRNRGFGALPRPGRSAGIIYLAGIAAMVAIMFIGSRLLAALGREDLQPAVAAVAVGVHFLPYARAVVAPVFGRLGSALALVGVLGLLLGCTTSGVAATGGAVLAVLVLLGGIARDARNDSP